MNRFNFILFYFLQNVNWVKLKRPLEFYAEHNYIERFFFNLKCKMDMFFLTLWLNYRSDYVVLSANSLFLSLRSPVNDKSITKLVHNNADNRFTTINRYSVFGNVGLSALP